MIKPHTSREHDSIYLAQALIEEHGFQAARHAAEEAQRRIGAADLAGGAAWMAVARAVDMILEARGSGTLH